MYLVFSVYLVLFYVFVSSCTHPLSNWSMERWEYSLCMFCVGSQVWRSPLETHLSVYFLGVGMG